MKPPAKIAIVYDRVNTPYGGAENVLVALHGIFPDAPLYTSVYDEKTAQWARVFTVMPSFLQGLPLAKRFHRLFAVMMPLAFEAFELSQFDIVISVTSAEAKGVMTKPHQLHICYLLTPTRYLWSHAEEYQRHWLTGWIRRLVFGYLRWWDDAARWRPDVLIPISRLVAERCQKYYQRLPEPVIYPPVSLPQMDSAQSSRGIAALPADLPSDFFLIVSRLVPYKRIDIAIQAAQQAGRNLVIIGQGPDEARLRRLAAKARIPAQKMDHFHSSNSAKQVSKDAHPTAQIVFLQAVQPADLIAYYTCCRAFILPAEEDFGITALEAMAHGKPVLIYSRSGAAEIVEDGVTGFHFHQQTPAAVAEAMHWSERISWSSEKIQQHVLQYGVRNFQHQFAQKVDQLWQAHVQAEKKIAQRSV